MPARCCDDGAVDSVGPAQRAQRFGGLGLIVGAALRVLTAESHGILLANLRCRLDPVWRRV